MSDSGMKWYVLRTMGGKEMEVKEYIEKNMTVPELKGHVSQVLVPTEKVFQVRNGKKIAKDRIYFPGYVLIEANLVGEAPHFLRNITNVAGFLGDEKKKFDKDKNPIPMRQSEINRILGKVDELSAAENESAITFSVGETVKIIDGPFNSFTGTVEEVREDRKKLKVIVKIFDRKTPLELGFMQVEKES